MSYERKHVADLLRRFVDGDVQDWEFDDFLSTTHPDPLIEEYKIELINLPSCFPPATGSHYVSQDGIKRILDIADALGS